MIARLTQTRPRPTEAFIAPPTIIGAPIPPPPAPAACYNDFRTFLTDLDASTDYTDWCAANPTDCATWTTYSNAILGGASPSPPTMSDAFGDALVDAGIIALDAITICLAALRITASFTYLVTGLTAAFTDTSIPGLSGPIISWLWNFGDGNTSTLQNPPHTYATPGTYVVTLIVNGTGGSSASTTRLATSFTPSAGSAHIEGVIF